MEDVYSRQSSTMLSHPLPQCLVFFPGVIMTVCKGLIPDEVCIMYYVSDTNYKQLPFIIISH